MSHLSSDEPDSLKPTAPLTEPPPKWKFWAKPDKEEKDPSTRPVPYFQLFRYSDSRSRFYLFISLICAIGHGVMLPVLTIVFGRIMDEFAVLLYPQAGNADPTNVSSEVEGTTRLFLILSFVAWIVSFVQLFFALRAANLIGNTLRVRFFNSLIRQHPSFYDDAKAGALTNLVVTDINLIQSGIGDKLATAVQYISTFCAGIIVGFIKGWKLTLVILGITPLLLVSGFIFGNASSEATGDSLGAYADANGIAFEILSLIRTVTAFNAQKSEVRRYDQSLDKAYKGSSKSAVSSGLGLGTAMFFIICTYGLALWFGANRIRAGEMKAGDVFVTFFALSLGASSLGTAGPAFKSFGKSRAAAPRVYEIIEAVSEIDPLGDNDSGIVLNEQDVHGRLTLEDVDFNYPNRITEADGTDLVLEKFGLDIPAGSSEAFVGKSGCGKSTIARLIQRLYDPLHGTVRLDGVDLRELNVRWLRSQIGVVAQTPSLFMLSIRDNIALGAGTIFMRDATTGKTVVTPQQISQDEIIAAAKVANAHDFISKLPEGYDTMLGERGAMLSGGQKQRVCIARAIVRNPKILLLDESTASLDTASERIVQDALERASSGRTTITIAHRLSTVRNADSISCIQDGHVIENGNHDTLITKEGGFYHGLFELQRIQRVKLEDDIVVQEEGDFLPLAAVSANEVSTTKGAADSSTKIDNALDKEDDKPAVDKGLFFRTMRLNAPEWLYLILGSGGALAASVVWPLLSIALVEMIETLVSDVNDTSRVRKWSLAFVVLGVIALIGNAFQHAFLGVSGERLTRRLRSMVFRQLLSQEIGFFDLEGNSLGALTTMLSSETGLVKGLTGDLFGILLNVVGALVTALIISFIACWQLTLVVLAIIPGVALGGYFEMQASAGIDSGVRKEFALANIIAAEAVDNVATVRTLGAEEHFQTRFTTVLQKTSAGKLRKDFITGFSFGFSEFCQFLIWYATFKAGGRFIELGYCTFPEMLQSSMALLFGAITLGNVAVFAPDVAASNVSATNVYRLLDRESLIDPSVDKGERMTESHGNVSVKDVHFEYPRRPDVKVLRGLSLAIEQGKTLAIVGTSGHGKSTIISLLQRFYSIRKGLITVDGQDIEQTNVNDLRSHIGVVSQEPELFDRSVFDNIAYGLPHTEGTAVSRDEIERVARLANAHDFVEALPRGYDTMVGARGDALSGGQRQRVAIARSLVRRPALLLLDEATSALDSSSERNVQQALDRAGEGRSTIVVAHRLSTVRNADVIVVVRKGRIVECGSHDVLLNKNGAYAKLIENQLTEV